MGQAKKTAAKSPDSGLKLRGTPIAHGLAVARVCMLGRLLQAPTARYSLPAERVEAELERFRAALAATAADLDQVYRRLRDTIAPVEAEIFRAHQLILQDPSFAAGVEEIVRSRRLNATAAVLDTVERHKARLRDLPDDYLRERAMDLDDLALRLACKLGDCFTSHSCSLHQREPVIVYADELRPSLLSEVKPENTAGAIASRGSATSHGAIIARSLDVPVVTDLPDLSGKLRCGQLAVLDGDHGLLILDPDEATVADYRLRQEEHRRALSVWVDLPPLMKDGTVLTLEANAAGLSDVVLAGRNRAAGIGLFRTEFPYLIRQSVPAEKDLYLLYRKILEQAPGPVTFRLLDVGGDKALDYLVLPEEANPFLGQRGVRLYDDHRQLIEPQVAALLRAGAGRHLRLLIPMVSTVEEIEAVRDCLKKTAVVLDQRGVKRAHNWELGIMIETPAAFLQAERLLAQADFASIGSNDLIQYVMAFDRNHPVRSPLLNGMQPALLGIYRDLAALGAKSGKKIGFCGELASEPEALPALVGLGLRQFSLNAPAIPPAKHRLSGLDLAACEDLARRLLDCERLLEVQGELARFAGGYRT